MTGLLLNEPILEALLELLEARLPTVIAEVNAEIDDAFALPEPAQFLDFMPAAGTLKGGTPAVCLQDLPAEFFDDLQFSLSANHGVGVAAVIQNADQRTLAWQLRRYTKAIARTIQLDRLEGPSGFLKRGAAAVWYTQFAGTEPGPLLERQPGGEATPPNAWESWTWLMLRCRRQEI